MKKYCIIGMCVIALGLVAHIPADAATYCINLASFCDRHEVSTDIYGNTYGHWDTTCSGLFSTPTFGTLPMRSLVADYGVNMWQFYFDWPTKTFDMYAYDKVDPPFTWIINAPFTFTVGPCPASAPQAGSPRSIDK